MNEMTIPDGWQIKPFSSLIKVENGYAFKSSDFVDKGNESVPIVRMSNIKTGKIDLSDCEYVGKEVVKGLEKFCLRKGDFIFGMSGSISNYGWISESDGECYQNQRVGRLKSTKSDSKFASYLFLSNQVQNAILSSAAGAAQLNISSRQIEEISVLTPPLPEQQKIASILTSVDDVIEKTQSQINKLQDLKKGTMNELLTRGIGHTEFVDSPVGKIPKGWEVVNLSSMVIVDRESLKNTTPEEYSFFYIDIASVKTGSIKKPTEKLKFFESPSRARRIVKKGDTLLSTVRPNLKAFAYVEDECTDCICSTGFSVLTPKKGTDGRFIYHSILSDSVTKQIDALVAGSNYPAINSSDVKSLLLVKPSFDEQEKIASVLSSIDKNIEDKQRKLEQTKSLKKSLMQDLLTGKVRVPLQ
jgi:type I restriction enzyme S subunit